MSGLKIIPNQVARLGGGFSVAGASGVTYLLRDEFTTAQAAPLTSPRTCAPGPGVLTITDPQNKFSIASGALSFAQGTADCYMVTAALARKAGLCIAGTLLTLTVNAYFIIGFNPNIVDAGTSNNAWWIALGESRADTLTFTLPGLSGATRYYVFLRSTGAFYVSKSISTGIATLQYVSNKSSTASAPMGIKVYVGDAAGTFDNAIVAQCVSPWNSDYGLATARVANASAGEIVTAQANVLTEFTLVAQAGVTQSIWFRHITDDETWRLDCDQAGGTIKLYTRTGGVDTEINAGKTQTWVAGNSYRIVIVADGSAIKTWVDTTAKHTATNAFNATATDVKVSHAGANLIAWPRIVTTLLPDF